MSMLRSSLDLLALLQALAGARVLWRLWRSRGGTRIPTRPAGTGETGAVSVIVPVLDEQCRLGPCLDGLLAQGPAVAEILVVDGGSRDGTQALVCRYAAREPRLRLVDASPIPPDWNGKAWGLQVGFEHADPAARWLLTIDADVRPAAGLVASLLDFAATRALPALSTATRQELRGPGLGLLHPALLATLVYRFGIPGHTARHVEEVQANGQCFMVRRAALAAVGGLVAARTSRCEDVTLARALVRAGYPVGFYEADDDLVRVEMYADAADAWRNWPRSLPMRDRFANRRALVGLAEVLFAQALPLPCFLLLAWLDWRAGRVRWRRSDRSAVIGRGAPARSLRGRIQLLDRRLARKINAVLLLARLGVLVGMRRAYRQPPWTYWLSPVLDLPVAVRLLSSALQPRQTWRGRALVTEGPP